MSAFRLVCLVVGGPVGGGVPGGCACEFLSVSGHVLAWLACVYL